MFYWCMNKVLFIVMYAANQKKMKKHTHEISSSIHTLNTKDYFQQLMPHNVINSNTKICKLQGRGNMLTWRRDTPSFSLLALATADCWFNDSPPSDLTMDKPFLNDITLNTNNLTLLRKGTSLTLVLNLTQISLQRNRQIVTFSRQSQHQMWVYWQPLPATCHFTHCITWQANCNEYLCFSDTHAVFPEQMFESQLWQSVLWSHLVWHNSLAIYLQLEYQNVDLKPRHKDQWPFVMVFSSTLTSYLQMCVLQTMD